MASYLDIAEIVLGRLDEPLTAKQILKYAREMKIIPTHLYGKTQHKTLQARIAEDILTRRTRSSFMRTEPGRFALRSKVLKGDYIHTLEEFPAPRRADQLRQFNVLCTSSPLTNESNHLNIPVTLSCTECLQSLKFEYRKLSEIWSNSGYLFARLFIVVTKDKRLAIFGTNRSKPSSDNNETGKSIGLSGYVKEQDANLFSSDEFGLEEAVQRTVMEQFHMLLPARNENNFPKVSIQGIIPTPKQVDENSFTVVAYYECPRDFDPVRQLGRSISAEWAMEVERRNDLSDFEIMSQTVILSGLINAAIPHEKEAHSTHPARRGIINSSAYREHG